MDQNDKIKIQFAYDPNNTKINILTDLHFSVLNLTTNERIQNFIARVVVIEGPELFGFNDIKVNKGNFSVKHSFTNYGNNQILMRVDTNSSITPASFDVMIPYQSPSFLIDADRNGNK